jgi:hypothetical protein
MRAQFIVPLILLAGTACTELRKTDAEPSAGRSMRDLSQRGDGAWRDLKAPELHVDGKLELDHTF